MAETAGVTTDTQRHELRRSLATPFMLTNPSGAPIQAVEFLGTDAIGRARFLHTGRAAPEPTDQTQVGRLTCVQ